jgi:hypothetical protein
MSSSSSSSSHVQQQPAVQQQQQQQQPGSTLLSSKAFITNLDDLTAEQRVVVIEVQSTDPNNQPWNSHSVTVCEERIQSWTNQYDYCMKMSKRCRQFHKFLSNAQFGISGIVTVGYVVVRMIAPEYWWVFACLAAAGFIMKGISIWRDFPQRANYYQYMAYRYLEAAEAVTEEKDKLPWTRSQLPMQLIHAQEHMLRRAVNQLEANKINDPQMAQFYKYKYKDERSVL